MDLFEYVEKCKREILISTLHPPQFDPQEKKIIREHEKIRKGEVMIIPKRRNRDGE